MSGVFNQAESKGESTATTTHDFAEEFNKLDTDLARSKLVSPNTFIDAEESSELGLPDTTGSTDDVPEPSDHVLFTDEQKKIWAAALSAALNDVALKVSSLYSSRDAWVALEQCPDGDNALNPPVSIKVLRAWLRGVHGVYTSINKTLDKINDMITKDDQYDEPEELSAARVQFEKWRRAARAVTSFRKAPVYSDVPSASPVPNNASATDRLLGHRPEDLEAGTATGASDEGNRLWVTRFQSLHRCAYTAGNRPGYAVENFETTQDAYKEFFFRVAVLNAGLGVYWVEDFILGEEEEEEAEEDEEKDIDPEETLPSPSESVCDQDPLTVAIKLLESAILVHVAMEADVLGVGVGPLGLALAASAKKEEEEREWDASLARKRQKLSADGGDLTTGA